VKIVRARFAVPTALGNTLDRVTFEDDAGNTRIVQQVSWTHAQLLLAAAGHTEVDLGDDNRLTVVATFSPPRGPLPAIAVAPVARRVTGRSRGRRGPG
jgi:hypothetical protein